ncbi:hypothetical protein PLICRDRAFT_35826 [Plicaturopsis crispa FD-325 SS-3]|nr:hypothetical protein PLICRDRAFT_35826 [Plicaturopsis crispa FD-325 SS-3]
MPKVKKTWSKNRKPVSRMIRAQIREMSKTSAPKDVLARFNISYTTLARVKTGKYAARDKLAEDALLIKGTLDNAIVIDDSSEESVAGEPTGNLGEDELEGDEENKGGTSGAQQDQPRRSTRERKRIKYEPESDDGEPPVIAPPRRATVIVKNPINGSTRQGQSTSSSSASSSSKQQAPASSASTSGATSSRSEMDPAVQEFFKGLGLKGLSHQFPILCMFGFRTTEDLDFHCMSVKDEGDDHLADLEGRLSAKGINGTEWMAISKGLKRRALSMN